MHSRMEHAGLWCWKYDPALDRAYLDIKRQDEFDLPSVMDHFLETWLSLGYVHSDYVDAYRDAIYRIKNGDKQVVMDGLTAARSIRNLKKAGSRNVPIIAITANAFDEDVKLSLSSDMDAHLTKPIEPKILYSTLQKLINN